MLNLYTIVLTRPAHKNLNGLDAQFVKRIATAIDALTLEPWSPGCTKIKSEDGVWRIRVGDYRNRLQH